MVAEVTLKHLVDEYQDGISERYGGEPLSRELDVISLACLLLCEEAGRHLSPASTRILTDCREAVARSGGLEWLDVLPWDLALESLGLTSNDPTRGMDCLVANLTHEQSGIRSFLFDVAWFVRNRLPMPEAANRLLRNTADTLGHWYGSFGLYSYLFPDSDRLWVFADSYQPKSFESQYRDRLNLVREHGLANCTSRFEALDSVIRRRICDCALGLRCEG